jgi:hypothetical protein
MGIYHQPGLQALKQEYMRHALMMDSAGLER